MIQDAVIVRIQDAVIVRIQDAVIASFFDENGISSNVANSSCFGLIYSG